MRELLTSLGIGLVVAWILERLPRLALALVRLAARLMPTPELREQMRDDWTADIMTSDGPLSALLASLSIVLHIPSIRMSFGYKPFHFSGFENILASSHTAHRYLSIIGLTLSLTLLAIRQLSLILGINIFGILDETKDISKLLFSTVLIVAAIITNLATRKLFMKLKKI